MLSAVVAMLHFPHVMRKAQAKLDNVVGPDNPEKSLPYANTLINETLR